MRTSFARKVIYMAIILGLFTLMFPVRSRVQTIRQDPQNRLAQEALTAGDVDATSTLAILVLGGLRGVACNILWSQALDFQKKKQWNELEAVVHSIVKLQPHFISIWTFQSWNLAYNISSEWDGVEDKYYWIKRGIKFVSEGINKNQHSPELRWDRGWYYFHKIGKADERTLLRKLYREDTLPEIDSLGREHEPFNPYGKDNYETAKECFDDAVATLDRLNVKPQRMSEVPFRSYPAHAQTDYAAAREEEGQFGETIQRDWLDAYQEWIRYGEHEYEFFDGKTVRLDYPPETYTALWSTKELLLHTDQIRRALATDPEKRQQLEEERPDLYSSRVYVKDTLSEKDMEVFFRHAEELIDQFGEPVLAILPDGARAAREALIESLAALRGITASQLKDESAVGQEARAKLEQFRESLHRLERFADEELYWNNRYANMVNYRYWKERSRAEATWDMIHAREHFYNATKAYQEGDPDTAFDEFEAGLKLWEKVLAKYPRIRNDDLTVEETAKLVKQYLVVRAQLDLPPPKKIPFEEFVRKIEEQELTPEDLLKYELYLRTMQKAAEGGVEPGPPEAPQQQPPEQQQ